MDVICIYSEVLVALSRERAFRAMVLEVRDIVVKLAPNVFERIDIISGDGGPGTILRTVYKEGTKWAAAFGDVKCRIDTLDTENYIMRETVIEGASLLENMHSMVYELQYEALGPDRCILKIATEYHPKEGAPFNLEESVQNSGDVMRLYKAIEEYLIKNPDVCT